MIINEFDAIPFRIMDKDFIVLMLEQIDNHIKDVLFNPSKSKPTNTEMLHIYSYAIAKYVVTGRMDECLLDESRRRFKECIHKSLTNNYLREQLELCYLMAYLSKIEAVELCSDMVRCLINIIISGINSANEIMVSPNIPYPYGIVLSNFWTEKDCITRYYAEECLIRCIYDCKEMLNRHVVNAIDINVFLLYYICAFNDWMKDHKIFPHKCEQIDELLSIINGNRLHCLIQNNIIEQISSLYNKKLNDFQDTLKYDILYDLGLLSLLYKNNEFVHLGLRTFHDVLPTLSSKRYEIKVLTLLGFECLIYLNDVQHYG